MTTITIAMRLQKDIERDTASHLAKTRYDENGVIMPPHTSEEAQAIFDMCKTQRLEKYKTELLLLAELKLISAQIIPKVEKVKPWLFITVRPKADCTWPEFKLVADKYLKSKRFLDGEYTWESTGMSIETLGEGFHLHIVASTSWATRWECIRDTKRAFKSCVAPAQCDIQEVSRKSDPQKIIHEYMVMYKSKDEHKEPHRPWDTLWRNSLSLGDHTHILPLSSPVTADVEFL